MLKKIDLCGKAVRRKRRCRHFNHHAYFNAIGYRLAFLNKLVLFLLEQTLGLQQLLENGDHREHNLQLAVTACPQKRAKLRTE